MPQLLPLDVLRRCLEQHVRHGVTIADAQRSDLPLVYVNQAFEAMTGYSRAELIGQNCRLMQRSDRRQAGVQAIRAARAAGLPVRVTLRNYRKDGTLFWSDLSLTPIFDSHGELTHYIGLQEDVTAQRKEQARLRRYQRQLTELAARLMQTETVERQKLACEVHDQVAQLLSLCRIQLGMLARKPEAAATQSELMTICSLVEVAIDETRGLIAGLRPPLLAELGVGTALQHLGVQLARRYLLTVLVGDELGALKLPEVVAQLVLRTARELVVNAAKHAAATTVRILLKRESGDLVLIVTDAGQGFQVKRVGEAEAGGFGLRSIRERASYFGGSLTVRSRLGQGTAVTLRLPQPKTLPKQARGL